MGFYAPAAPAGVARAAGGGAGAGRVVMAHSSGVTRAWVPVPPPRDQGLRMAGTWPLRTYLEFGAFPGAVPCARLHARAVLWEWGLIRLTEQVELLVSELVTNAVQESRLLGEFTTVRFWLLSDRRKVLIQVWDASQCPPHPEEPSDEIAEGGRGLLLVAAMSERWSWHPAPETGGKVVWALCGPSAERGSGNAR